MAPHVASLSHCDSFSLPKRQFVRFILHRVSRAVRSFRSWDQTLPSSFDVASNDMDDNKDRRSKEEMRIPVTEARKLFPSLFFGWSPDDDPKQIRDNQKGILPADSVDDARDRRLTVKSRQQEGLHDKEPETDTADVQKPAPSAAEKAAEQIASLVKKDPRELRDSWLFKEAYKQIQWQRDSYFVGPEYANWSGRRRLREEQNDTRSVKAYLTLMPYDDSKASQQLAKIAADFIPSRTVTTVLIPIVVKLPQGPLYRPTQTALVNVIRNQQGLLDRVIKNSIIGFLDNPRNRQNIKNSTKGYISKYDRD